MFFTCLKELIVQHSRKHMKFNVESYKQDLRIRPVPDLLLLADQLTNNILSAKKKSDVLNNVSKKLLLNEELIRRKLMKKPIE